MYTTILVWLLISGDGVEGTRVVAKFKDQVQCEHVRKNVNPNWMKCVQANIVKDW